MSDVKSNDEMLTENVYGKLAHVVMTVYGPYAFSVVALLLIWFFIVGPQLERTTIDYRENQKIVQTLYEISKTQNDTADSMRTTASILDKLLQRIEDRSR